MAKKCFATDEAGAAKLQELADYLKVISDPHRLRIICLLTEGERCVCDIHAPLGLPQNLTSHHLKALRDADLVKARRQGKWVFYRLNFDKILRMTDLYASILLTGD